MSQSKLEQDSEEASMSAESLLNLVELLQYTENICFVDFSTT